MARKLALIIGNSQYQDACLAKLTAPEVDVRELVDTLQSPNIGNFDEVVPLLNEDCATVRRAIARFFEARGRDDLLLMYFSGHGVRDDHGHLYLAVRDTERDLLSGTAIEASFVTARMDRSQSKRLVLILDCCHSGAFGYGAKGVHGASVGTATAFEGTGRGRVVLTATDSTQYAWEGDQVSGETDNSLFTHHLIAGLKSGAADRDEDGLITIDELYEYIHDQVLNDTTKQTPGKWAFGQQGEIVIAQNLALTRVKLPPELEESIASTLPSVRLNAAWELYGVARGRHEGRARAAREALQRLAEDDSRRVAAAAVVLIQALDGGETLAEDEWRRRIRALEEQQSGRKTAAAQIESYLALARECMARRAFEDVRLMLAQVLKLDSANAEAHDIGVALQHALEEQKRLEAEALLAKKLQEQEAIAAAAEARRLEEEQRRIEAQQLAEQEQRRLEAQRRAEEDQRRLEAQRLAKEEQRRIEAKRRAEEEERRLEAQRLAEEEQRRLEAQRLAEEETRRIEAKRRAEEERRLAEVAEAQRLEARRQAHAAAIADVSGQIDRELFDAAERTLEALEGEFGYSEESTALRARLASIRRKQQHERDAHQTVATAASEFERGQHHRAIAILQRFTPPHPVVTEALQTLTARLERLERQREEEACARAVEEQLERAETLARLLTSVRTALKAGRTPEAARALSEARAIDPEAPELNELAEAIRAAIENEEKALRAREEIRDSLGRATKCLGKRDFAGALALVDAVLAREPQHADALELRARIHQARQQPVPPGVLERLSTAVGSRGVRVTGGLVLAAALGVFVYQQVSKPNPPPGIGVQQPASQAAPQTEPTKPKTDPPPSAAQKDPAPETPVPEAAPAPAPTVVRDSRVVTAERRAVQQIAAGNSRRAMDYIKEGLGIAPDDAGLRKLRRDIRGTAQRDAEAARRRAVDAGLRPSSSFWAADAHLEAGHRDTRAGREEDAIGQYWEATTGFREAKADPVATDKPAPKPDNNAPGPKPAEPVAPSVPSESSLVALFDAAIKARDPGEARRALGELERLYRNSAHLARMRSALAALEAPPPPSSGFNEAGVREAVETFAKVFSTLDPAAVRNLYPSMPAAYARSLEKFRKEVKGYRMTVIVDRDRVRLEGTRASVRLTVFHNGVPDEGGSFNPTSQETWEFEWNGQRWLRTK